MNTTTVENANRTVKPTPVPKGVKPVDHVKAYADCVGRIKELRAALAKAEAELPSLRDAAKVQAATEKAALDARAALLDSVLGE